MPDWEGSAHSSRRTRRLMRPARHLLSLSCQWALLFARACGRNALLRSPGCERIVAARETLAADDLREHPARTCGRPLSPGGSRRIRAGRRRSCGSSAAGVSRMVTEPLVRIRMQQRRGARSRAGPHWCRPRTGGILTVVARAKRRRSVRRVLGGERLVVNRAIFDPTVDERDDDLVVCSRSVGRPSLVAS